MTSNRQDMLAEAWYLVHTADTPDEIAAHAASAKIIAEDMSPADVNRAKNEAWQRWRQEVGA